MDDGMGEARRGEAGWLTRACLPDPLALATPLPTYRYATGSGPCCWRTSGESGRGSWWTAP